MNTLFEIIRARFGYLIIHCIFVCRSTRDVVTKGTEFGIIRVCEEFLIHLQIYTQARDDAAAIAMYAAHREERIVGNSQHITTSLYNTTSLHKLQNSVTL